MKIETLKMLAACAALFVANVATAQSAQTDIAKYDSNMAIDGAEARIAAAWKSRMGEPYAERAVLPPAFKGHPPIARDYSASIINFALRVFHNGETNFFALANRKLAENCRYYIDNTEVRDDRDSFYWDIGQLCRIVYHYGSRGDVKPGLLEPETEAVFREMAFGYCNDLSRVADADPGRTWHVWESGNHHVQRASAFWQLLHFLANLDPSCGATVLKDGHSLDEHCRAWSDFFRAWMRERARRSMFIEVQSRCYGIYTIKNLYPLYDFSDDPSLRRLARDFLDLFWALWAQEQIGGAQGGGMSRVYSVQGRRTAAVATRWAYWYFGIAGACRPEGIDYVCIDSAYRPSALVCELARDVAARGVYEIESRPLGWALPEDRYPDYRPDPEWGRIYRYTYATPDFIVGTLMFPQAPSKDWCAISSQNRFQSVVYGPPNAQLIPLPAPLGRHSLEKKPPTTTKNAFWSLQRKGTLITRRNRFAGSAGTMQVWFSAAGGVDRVEKDGDWHFIRCGNALSAVRVVCGGSRLVTAGPEDREVTCEQEGKFLVCEDKMSPVIVETARLGDFADEAAFREKVKSTELRLGDSTLDYVGIFGNRFHMDLGDGGASTVDGEPYVRKTEWSFRSPFVQERWNEGVVRLRFAGKEQELDFRD